MSPSPSRRPGIDMSFSAFKERFYNAFDDPQVFDCQQFNLLKVVLDGLKVDYLSSLGEGYQPLLLPGETVFLLALARQKAACFVKGRSLPAFHPVTILVLEDPSNRKAVFQGQPASFFFAPTLYALQQQGADIRLMLRRSSPGETSVEELAASLYASQAPGEYRELRNALRHTFGRIAAACRFDASDLTNIQIAFFNFYHQFVVYHKLLGQIRPQHLLFTQHYHFEGLMAAAKMLGIHTVEYQHGIIAPEDIFYVLPEKVRPVIARALFPDHLAVFGPYWKQVLGQGVEFREEQLIIIGYPFVQQALDPIREQELEQLCGGRPVLLVATQTYLAPAFIAYVQRLAQTLEADGTDAAIWLKPHPNEKKSDYESLLQIPSVTILTDPVDVLLRKAKAVISIYSTVLYDASRFGVPAFAVDVPEQADYIHTVVQSGIVSRIGPEENPLNRILQQARPPVADVFYAPFAPEKLLPLLS